MVEQTLRAIQRALATSLLEARYIKFIYGAFPETCNYDNYVIKFYKITREVDDPDCNKKRANIQVSYIFQQRSCLDVF